MKHIDYYREVGVTPPSKADHTTRYWYKNGEVYARQLTRWVLPKLAPDFTEIPTAKELVSLPNERVVDEEVYRKLRSEFTAARRAKEAEFKKDVLEYAGLADDPAADVIYHKAWEDGHAHGLDEVRSCLERLASFIGEVDVARAEARGQK